MSARVSPSSWGWYCPECGDGEDNFATDAEATVEATWHDERCHR